MAMDNVGMWNFRTILLGARILHQGIRSCRVSKDGKANTSKRPPVRGSSCMRTSFQPVVSGRILALASLSDQEADHLLSTFVVAHTLS